MVDAGIFDSDIALINPRVTPEDGDIVIVILGDETVIKRYYKEKNRIRLVSDNKYTKPVTLHSRYVRIIGKVVGILRKF